jgi:hypothetical protein
MADSPKTKSPKRRRKAKAAASPETEAAATPETKAAAAPETKAAAAPETKFIDSDKEDYNIRSPERTELLTQIKKAIGNVHVSPSFWACCQLADMTRLQAIAKSDQEMILVSEDSLAFIAVKCGFLGFWAKSRSYI